MLDLGEPSLGAVAALLGARRFRARFADRLERRARGLVGGSELGLGCCELIGGGAACHCRGLDLGDQRLPLFGEFFRRAFEFGALVPGLFSALSDDSDLGGGAIFPLLPGGALAGDCLQPAVGKLGLARDRLRLAPDLGERAAVAGDHFFDVGELAVEIGGRRQGGECCLGFMAPRHRLVAAGDGALPCFLECGNARGVAADLALGGGMVFARGIGRVPGLAQVLARLRLRRNRGRERRFGGDRDAALVFDLTARGNQFAFDRFEPAALGEPARRAGGGVGGDGKTVPAPQIAIARDEPLAGLEHRRKARAVRAFNHADLREPTRQFRRRGDELSERGCIFRQDRIGWIERRAGPAHRRGRVHRRIEVVAQRCAQRLLVSFGDGQRVHHRRPQIFALDGEQLADGLGFGFQSLHAPLGGGERLAGGVDLVARLRERGFRAARGGFRVGEGGLGGRQRLREQRQIRFAAAGRREACVDIGKLGLQALRLLLVVAQGGLELIAAGGQIGERAGQLGKRLLRRRERHVGGSDAVVDAGQARGVCLRFGLQRFLLGAEAVERCGSVGRERAFAIEIGGELLEPAVEFGNAFLGAGFFAFERIAGNQEPLQRGRGARFRLAQRRQACGDQGLSRGGRGVFGGARGDDAHGFVARALGLGDFGSRRRPAQMKQQRLGLPHLRRRRCGNAPPAAPGS